MKIALKVNLLVAALGRERALELVPEIRHREESQRVPLDITRTTIDEVDKIAKVAATENRALARRISSWKDLRATPDGKPIKNALQLETALIAFVMQCPHKILFMRSEDGQMLPYFVQQITWHKLRRVTHRGGVSIYPAHTVLSLAAFKDESKTSRSVTWTDTHPVHGGGDFEAELTVSGLLEGAELFPEKEKSYAAYEAELKRFHSLYKKMGAQFSAMGRCYGEVDDEWSYSNRKGKTTGLKSLTRDDKPSRVVIDPYGDKGPEEEDDEDVSEGTITDDFWPKYDALAGKGKDIEVPRTKEQLAELKLHEDDEEGDIDEDTQPEEEGDDNDVVLPVHPYLQVFDFQGDEFVTCHVNCLTEYEFDVGIQKKLILPETIKKLVTVLIGTAKEVREDIIAGKTGGVIVMSTGEPGTGKTLTAEVFAEQMKIPIYTVQCSQLGTNSTDLEAKLIVVLKRAMRWGALLLLDECDVYTRTRENDIEQNAIVGVFLRLLEKFRGILFMTSNRAAAIDDAILSRCIAHIRYELPNQQDSELIWEVLAENYSVDLMPKEITKLAEEFPLISGRNIKTLLKLATSVAAAGDVRKKGEISGLIREMSRFVDFPKSHHEALKALKK